MKVKSLLFVILSLFIFMATGCVKGEKQLVRNNSAESFEILFWAYNDTSIEDLQKLTYNQIVKKYTPLVIVNDEFVEKYYWEEQLIEIQYDRLRNERGIYHLPSGGFFTIAINNQIVCHGINRYMFTNKKDEYTDADYPAIVILECKNQKNALIAIQPKSFSALKTFRDFEGEEKKDLLNQEVLEFFSKQGKIVRGNIDLESLFARGLAAIKF